MKRILFIIISTVLFLQLSAGSAAAETKVAGQSAQLAENSEITQNESQDIFLDTLEYDLRLVKLRVFLEKHNSPMKDNAKDFIEAADEYDLPWNLVASISGVESTFGKHIPYGSYNAFGWANGSFQFESWKDAINTVSRALRQKYIDRGAENLTQVAYRYAPPSALRWESNVRYFMNEIDRSKKNDQDFLIALSL